MNTMPIKINRLFEMLRQRKNRQHLYCKAEYWDSKAVEYTGSAVSMWKNTYLNACYHQEQAKILSKYLSDVSGKYILDLGCGTGRISKFLAERGAKVLAIDFSAQSINIAKKENFNENIQYRVQSMLEIDEHEEFDFVVSWGSITFACKNNPDLKNLAARLEKALKNSGELLLFEPIHKGFLHRVLKMNLKEFKEVMEKENLEIVEITNLHFWPMRLLLAYIPWSKAVTLAGYQFGQWFMGLLGNKALGDYKAIRIRKKRLE